MQELSASEKKFESWSRLPAAAVESTRAVKKATKHSSSLPPAIAAFEVRLRSVFTTSKPLFTACRDSKPSHIFHKILKIPLGDIDFELNYSSINAITYLPLISCFLSVSLHKLVAIRGDGMITIIKSFYE